MHAGQPAGESTSSRLNREYYDRLTEGQDDYWRLMAAPRFRVATILQILSRHPPHRLADLGCGNGQLLREIAAQHPGASLAGIDLSAALVEQNSSRLPQMAWYQRDLQIPVAGEDPLTSAFDTIVSSEVIEHLDEPEVLLMNARRLASPGARLILTTQSGPIRVTEREVGHRQHFTVERLSTLLQANGWTADRVWNAGFPFHDLSKWAANISPQRSLRGFGTARYGAGQKLVCAALRAAFRFNSSHRGAQLFAVAVRA
jgi:2-polyprenyl-3-methyl-5-hydroxy-6-metoxy-1,4-benzoquinol methylase